MNGKIKIIVGSFILLILINCNNDKKENLFQLAELKNYKITTTKINDSIVKINGSSKDYTIEGNMNIYDSSRQNWWKINNQIINEKYEIEYVYLDKQIENQIKVYKNGKLYKRASKFYTKSINNNKLSFNFYFPVSKFNTSQVNFNYAISDTIERKIIKEGKLNCINKTDHYYCSVPISKNESIIGIVTNFSDFKKKDSVNLAVDRMFIK
ncbi:hypothetical protein ODZ84_01895 [Chryseobacterium fluminis]|uniref:hypothetical protein n=1 Tax=Chryseobacterium fluminis TaxID=2983606 RepID=UPI0022592395|nr:hypothetical protein [Chryseobacterium sp. MMS21-Ot14]UZT98344.1 hypothetical protein ODZ84_01895 [Chryseobacterium sp. MMS21-Ot14]